MFHFRCLKIKTNNVLDKALNIVDSDYKSTFQELLNKEVSFSVHQGNIQTLEIYIHIHGLFLTVKEEVFKLNRTLPYNLRKKNEFYSRVLYSQKIWGNALVQKLLKREWRNRNRIVQNFFDSTKKVGFL